MALALDSAPHGEATGWRRGEELMTALPYVDALTEAEKQMVEALIQEEAKKGTKRPSEYLKEIVIPPVLKFEGHPMLQADYKRVLNGEPLPPMDTARLMLPEPPINKRNDVAAWRAALDNAHSQLEHQYNRLLNLELLLQYGATVWQAQLKHLESAVKEMTEAKSRLKAEADEVNRERKLRQVSAGAELKALEERWKAVVATNMEIEDACKALEAEIRGLEAKVPKKEATPPPVSHLPPLPGEGGAVDTPMEDVAEED